MESKAVLVRKRLQYTGLTVLAVFAVEAAVALLSIDAEDAGIFRILLAVILCMAIFIYYYLRVMSPAGQYFFDNEGISVSAWEGSVVRHIFLVLNLPFVTLLYMPEIPLPVKLILALVNSVAASHKAYRRIYRLAKGNCRCIPGKMSSKWMKTISLPVPHVRRGYHVFYNIVLFEPEEGKPMKVAADKLTYLLSKSGRDAVLVEYKTGEDKLYVELIPLK